MSNAAADEIIVSNEQQKLLIVNNKQFNNRIKKLTRIGFVMVYP